MLSLDHLKRNKQKKDNDENIKPLTDFSKQFIPINFQKKTGGLKPLGSEQVDISYANLAAQSYLDQDDVQTMLEIEKSVTGSVEATPAKRVDLKQVVANTDSKKFVAKNGGSVLDEIDDYDF